MYSFSFSDNFSGRNLVWMKRGDSRAIKIKTEDQIWSLFGDDVKKEVLKHGKIYKFEFSCEICDNTFYFTCFR